MYKQNGGLVGNVQAYTILGVQTYRHHVYKNIGGSSETLRLTQYNEIGTSGARRGCVSLHETPQCVSEHSRNVTEVQADGDTIMSIISLLTA